ncbi:hypothetical protein E1B28_009353 [Marasmius oreades]|uniref:Uncharacterized protein n=1 Tax=Marasmius oreades TaxID=181124 RepID=A0A9P7UU84_9AGAR|nr:uncharacterized protein E1B28_009353 [Marasmius oreades]KAG7093061.1 hypothetical protein E1B28_009353 [Marasmius oreades]
MTRCRYPSRIRLGFRIGYLPIQEQITSRNGRPVLPIAKKDKSRPGLELKEGTTGTLLVMVILGVIHYLTGGGPTNAYHHVTSSDGPVRWMILILAAPAPVEEKSKLVRI